MRRFFIAALTILCGTFFAMASEGNSFELVSKRNGEMIVKVKVDGFKLKPIRDGNKVAYLPVINNGAKKLQKGFPDLQHLTTSLIKESNTVSISVIDKKVKTFSNIDILPSKGNIYRNQDPSAIPYTKGAVYAKDEFYPSSVYSLGSDYQFRDFQGMPLKVTPMQYNPVSKELKLFTEITLKITFSGASRAIGNYSSDFEPLYKHHFLNFNSARYTPLPEQGEMLIFTHQNFDQDIQPFVDWKNKIGVPTTLVRIDTLGSGTASDIKAYISNYYQNNNLTFVMLVGDANYVPTNSISSGDSDNEYGYLSGNDSYPEVIIGRFSAETSSHVNTMVQRTITYETGMSNGGSWLNSMLGLSSSQGPGDDNEMDYEHIRNMQIDLQNYTYTTLLEMFDGSQGGSDAAGNPTASMVSQAVEQGLGNILYTGHGSTYSWGSSGFSNTEIDQLSNTESWPFIWSVACVNGNFVNNTCFAESWTRASKNGTPTGAIAALMSTINQSWDPPMHAQDEMVDILVETYANNIKRTFGGISMNGCMAMNDAYGYQGDEMTDTWTLFGDPSIMVRTDTSKTLNVNYTPALFIGDTALTVNVPVTGARVALSVNNQLLDVEYVQNGSATLNFPAFSNPDTLTLAVVAYNHDIHFGEVSVMPANGPYVTFKQALIDDSQGNDDQGADQGESIMLDVELENIGLNDAQGVSATLSTTDTTIVLGKDSASWGSILSKDSSSVAAAFDFQVKPGVANGHKVSFKLQIADNNQNTWNSAFDVVLEAPAPEALSLNVDDDTTGNADGRLNAGEKAIIAIQVKNNGLSDYSYAWCTLVSSSTYVDVIKPFETIQSLAEGQSQQLLFEVEVDPNIPDGTTVKFDLDVDGGLYSAAASFYEVIGNIHEDFETKDFSRFSWNPVGINGWEIDTTVYYAGNASAMSGLPYGQHSSTSTLIISLSTVKDDTISFYRKVNSEQDYDYMKFFIDNQMLDQWSGFKNWEKFSYPVSAGSHTFKWTYEKDPYVSSGADKAWIDDVKFPAISTPAGIEGEIMVSSVNIYPNPAANIQHVELKLSRSANVIAELVDMTGKTVKTIQQGNVAAGEKKFSYNLSNLSSGMYFLRIQIGDEQHIFKVIH